MVVQPTPQRGGPEEDTEWNDILRAKGILPPKELEFTEEDIIELVDAAAKEKLPLAQRQLEDCTLDELDELEDERDADAVERYRRQRIAEIQALQSRDQFGRMDAISKVDYTRQVTEASQHAWVLVYLYQTYIPACELLTPILDRLAATYRTVKFIRMVATQCMDSYPDRLVPTLLIYHDGELQHQLVGSEAIVGGSGKRIAFDAVDGLLLRLGVLDKGQASYERPRYEEEKEVDDSDSDSDW